MTRKQRRRKKLKEKNKKNTQQDMTTNKKETIDLDLFINGLDFVLSATELIVDDSKKTNKKFAILHLSAGIDIVFKEYLRIMDWTQLFKNTKDAKEELLKSGDFWGVDSGTLRERLKKHCNVNFSKTEESTLKILRKKRNLIEHYHIKDNVSSLKSLFAESLSILIGFIGLNSS